MPHCRAAPHNIFPLITLACVWLGEAPVVIEKTMLNDLILVKSVMKTRAPLKPRLTYSEDVCHFRVSLATPAVVRAEGAKSNILHLAVFSCP